MLAHTCMHTSAFFVNIDEYRIYTSVLTQRRMVHVHSYIIHVVVYNIEMNVCHMSLKCLVRLVFVTSVFRDLGFLPMGITICTPSSPGAFLLSFSLTSLPQPGARTFTL